MHAQPIPSNPDRQQRTRNTLPFYFDPVPDIINQDIASGRQIDDVKLIDVDARVIGRLMRQRRPAGYAPGHECTKEAIAAKLGKSPRTIQRSFARLKKFGHLEHVPDTSDPTGYRLEFPSLRPPRLAPGTGASPPPDTDVSPVKASVSPPPSLAEGTHTRMQTETETHEFAGRCAAPPREEKPKPQPASKPAPSAPGRFPHRPGQRDQVSDQVAELVADLASFGWCLRAGGSLIVRPGFTEGRLLRADIAERLIHYQARIAGEGAP